MFFFNLPGGFLEPNCHFWVNADALPSLQSLVSLLRSAGVDCSLQAESYKIRCNAYKEHSRVEFVVRIFSPDPNACYPVEKRYVVEFQRRFGDGVLFHRIYRNAQATLLQQKEVNSNQSTPKTSTWSLTPPTLSSNHSDNSSQSQSQLVTLKDETPFDALLMQPNSNTAPMECLPCPSLCRIMLANLDKPCIVECVSKSIRCLVSMCETDCMDIKSQGLCALASMSDRQDFHPYLIQFGVVQLFLNSITCLDEDAHRCCITGLANLTETNLSVCEQIMNNTKVKERLCNLSHSQCSEIVRQVAKTVKNLSQQMQETISNDVQLREVVEYLVVCNDEQARAAAVAVLETCGA